MLRDVANGWLVFDDGGPCVPVPDGVRVRAYPNDPRPDLWEVTGARRGVLMDAGISRKCVYDLLALVVGERVSSG